MSISQPSDLDPAQAARIKAQAEYDQVIAKVRDLLIQAKDLLEQAGPNPATGA